MRFRHKAGDVLQVRFPEESSYFEPEDIPLAVVYEDEDLLVVDKQPGLVIHPTKNYQSGTLANALAHRMRLDGANYKIRFVNRLDRDTSGLVMIAKNAHCQKHISDDGADEVKSTIRLSCTDSRSAIRAPSTCPSPRIPNTRPGER